LVTDGSWQSRPGPVLFSGIYDGEHVDARLAVPDWSLPACDPGGWTGVRTVDVNAGPFCGRLSPPIRRQAQHAAVEIIRTPKGETVLDFGRTWPVWVTFDADLPEGEEVFLQYGELLQDGCFYRENLRSAKAEFRYISDGRPAHVRPRFTFYGFRYVRVEGLAAEAANMTAHVIHSQMDEIGEIVTSDARVTS
jgi:alpha-L-rhamnosidase